jgi:hypothetical protein
MRNNISADLHSSSITFTVMDDSGKVLEHSTIGTSEKLVLDYLSKIKGEKWLTFEEGPLAQWMFNITRDKVDKVIVCDPKANALIYKGNSNDDIDSKQLADLLRCGKLKEVVHPENRDRQEFRELINTYFKVVKNITQAKNRLKFTFKMKGLFVSGSKIYNEDNRDIYVDSIKTSRVGLISANVQWAQIDLLNQQKEIIYNELKKYVKKYKEKKEFLEIPGV